MRTGRLRPNRWEPGQKHIMHLHGIIDPRKSEAEFFLSPIRPELLVRQIEPTIRSLFSWNAFRCVRACDQVPTSSSSCCFYFARAEHDSQAHKTSFPNSSHAPHYRSTPKLSSHRLARMLPRSRQALKAREEATPSPTENFWQRSIRVSTSFPMYTTPSSGSTARTTASISMMRGAARRRPPL